MERHLAFYRAILTSLVFALAMSFTSQSASYAAVPGLVSGTVRAPNGAAVVNATVELVDKTGVVQRIKTDTTGKFQFGNVVPGSYSIRATAPKFQTATSAPFLVTAATSYHLTFCCSQLTPRA